MSPVVRRPLLPSTVAALALLLASCGGSGDGADQPSVGPAARQSEGAGDAPAGSARDAADAASGRGPAGQDRPRPAAGDLANFSCAQRPNGVWSASGDITNSAKEQRTYLVTVVTVEGADVAGERTEELTLEPEESIEFTMRRISRGPADACLPRLLAPR